MGKCFDSLVEFTRNYATDKDKIDGIPNIKSYLEEIIERCALFQFPINAQDIFPKSGKASEEYNDYLNEYFNFSEQNGSFLLTPFPITAIEDDTTVVILDNVQNNEYRLVMGYGPYEDPPIRTVVCSHIEIMDKFRFDLPIQVIDTFAGHGYEGKRLPSGLDSIEKLKDIANGVTSYVEQLVYIMDPENFIIRKENNASRKMRMKKGGKRKKLQKTIMRPHYICLDHRNTRSFLQREARDPSESYLVIGHKKTLRSEYYKKMQNQIIFIEQHFRGQGKIEGTGGWQYEVMVKKSPTSLVAYNEEKV